MFDFAAMINAVWNNFMLEYNNQRINYRKINILIIEYCATKNHMI